MQHADERDQSTSPRYRGYELEEFRELVNQSRKEALKNVMQDCVDREAYEHAQVVRRALQDRNWEGEHEKPHPEEAGKTAEHISEAFSIEEQVQIVYSLLDSIFREIREGRPRISEWVNCTLTQIEAVIDALRHHEVPRDA